MVRLHYMDMQFYLEDLLGVPVDLVLADCMKPRLQPIIAQLAGRDQGRDTTDRLAKDRGSSESAPARIFRCQHPGGVGHSSIQTGPPSCRLP